MSKVTLELVVAPSFLEKAGVKPGDPLQKRIAALKGATIGVAAIGGTQETAARWLAAKGGLDPKADIKIAQVGSPPALQAALENKRIDAFVLSPPEGYLATKAGAGTILISLGDEFPLLANQPYLVLVAKKPIDDKTSELIVKTAAGDADGERGAGQGPRADRCGDPEAVFRQGRSRLPSSPPSSRSTAASPAAASWTSRVFRTSWCFPRKSAPISARSSTPRRRRTTCGPTVSSNAPARNRSARPSARLSRSA